MDRTTRYRKVAVVGAGFAGLSAAVRLQDAGAHVVVFEARNRVGGRVWSESLDQEGGMSPTVERGAEFVLNGYETLRRIARRLDLHLVDTGMSYYIRSLVEAPHISPDDIAAAGARAARLAEEMTGSASAEDVLERLEEDPDLVEALRARIEISTAVEASGVTADTLHHVASFKKQPSWRIGGGNQRLATGLASLLHTPVRLNERVHGVSSADGVVSVETDSGVEDFDAVVIALPLAIVRDPGLVRLPRPEWKRAALERVVQGHAAKLHLPLADVKYTSATMSVPGRFWNWTAVDESGAVAPVLNGFMGSESAMQSGGVDESAERWARAVRSTRPDLEFATSAALLTNWSTDEWARGAYSAHSPETQEGDAEALERPVDGIYFAGEYTDPEYTGLMEGALRSGERAAFRITEAVLPRTGRGDGR